MSPSLKIVVEKPVQAPSREARRASFAQTWKLQKKENPQTDHTAQCINTP